MAQLSVRELRKEKQKKKYGNNLFLSIQGQTYSGL